jgi:hypothetical protein
VSGIHRQDAGSLDPGIMTSCPFPRDRHIPHNTLAIERRFAEMEKESPSQKSLTVSFAVPQPRHRVSASVHRGMDVPTQRVPAEGSSRNPTVARFTRCRMCTVRKGLWDAVCSVHAALIRESGLTFFNRKSVSRVRDRRNDPRWPGPGASLELGIAPRLAQGFLGASL